MGIVIFGNSGSGKSTIARALGKVASVPVLDLDTIAWKEDQPGVREDVVVSLEKLKAFRLENERWIIEGCYSGLISAAAEYASEIIFLNPGIENCVANCRARKWEPHKYTNQEEQDKNLDFLLEWVREYESRDDEFSLSEHLIIYNAFQGKKTEVKSNEESADLVSARS